MVSAHGLGHAIFLSQSEHRSNIDYFVSRREVYHGGYLSALALVRQLSCREQVL
jgi:hypothetical protein